MTSDGHGVRRRSSHLLKIKVMAIFAESIDTNARVLYDIYDFTTTLK